MKNKDFKVDINLPDVKTVKKYIYVLAASSGVVLGLVVALSIYFQSYRWDYQSPILLTIQSPIVVTKIKVENEVTTNDHFVEVTNVVEAATESAKVDETLSISQRGIDCVNKNPGLSGKIKEQYGEQWQMAAELICRESSFNPGAINPTSGACGLGQALPCKKMQCELSDVNCQLEWIGDYVESRYGNFENAVIFHNEKGWY